MDKGEKNQKQTPVTRRTYLYDSSSDTSKLRLGFIIGIVAFFVILCVMDRHIDLKPRTTEIIAIFLLFCAVYVIGSFISLASKRQRMLKMTDTEVYYLYGLWSKQKVVVPLSKVQSCQIGEDFFQKACETSTLSIYTTGDRCRIRFKDIRGGQEVCDFIMKKIR